MGNRDRKDDLEFSSEELSDLEQSLEQRSRIAPQGRQRKRTYRRGLKVPSEVVPHRQKDPEMVFELGDKPRPRKPSSKTLPMMEPVSGPPVLKVGPPPVDLVGKDAEVQPSNPTPVDLQSITPQGDAEDQPTEPFLGSPSTYGKDQERVSEDRTLPLDFTALGSATPEQGEVPVSPTPRQDAADEVPGDSESAPGAGEAEEPAPVSGAAPPDEGERAEPPEAAQGALEQAQATGVEAEEQDPEDAATELDLHPPFVAAAEQENPEGADEAEQENPEGADEAEQENTEGADEAPQENTEIPLEVAKEAVKLALSSASEAQVILPTQGGPVNEFDFDSPTSPGSSKAMEALGENAQPEAAGERANRVAILLSALNRPAVEKEPPSEGPPPSTPAAEEAPPSRLQRYPSEDISLDFEAPEDKGSGEVEELSTEELEEVSSDGFVSAADDASLSPPPIPDEQLSPFADKDDVPPAEVQVAVAEDQDGVMTSAPIESVSPAVEASGAAAQDAPLETTQPLPKSDERSRPQEPSAQPPIPKPPETKPPESSPIPALARGRKRKKTWFEEIFDEDWLRTLPGRSAKRTSTEVNFLEESLQPSIESQLLDLGCGDGSHTIELASRGFQVMGYDLSLPLLIRAADEAQRRGLQANFVHGDFRDLSFVEQFDAIFCLGSSFGFFDDDSNRKMIQAVNTALRVGGRFLLEMANRDYLIEDLPARIWWEGEGCVILEEVDFNFFTSRIISKRSVVFEDGRHLEQEISMRSYSLHELGKILHHAGFRVLEVTGNMAHRTRYFGNHSRSLLLLAEKRPQ